MKEAINSENRCSWCGSDPLYIKYHDEDWGVPVFNDRELFAKLILDGAQAGLSWITILKKRDNYYRAFDDFNAEKIAKYDDQKFQELMHNPGIVRNKLKVKAAITNAQAYLEIKHSGVSFSDYLWKFIGEKPILNHWKEMSEIPVHTPVSDAMSKALKKDGFKFVGTTIVYAFMQAVGMVNDHVVSCFRHQEVQSHH